MKVKVAVNFGGTTGRIDNSGRVANSESQIALVFYTNSNKFTKMTKNYTSDYFSISMCIMNNRYE